MLYYLNLCSLFRDGVFKVATFPPFQISITSFPETNNTDHSKFESNQALASTSAKKQRTCLKFQNPIEDAISRIRFAPTSNNLLISSWDSTLRLYDVDNSVMRLEDKVDFALLGCCFHGESAAISIASDCCVRRHDFGSGICSTLGNHNDLATCVEYSDEISQVVTAGLDKQIHFWDFRTTNGIGFSKVVGGEVNCMSLCGLTVMVAIRNTVNSFDLRNLERPVQTKESSMDHQIRSICSFPNCKGYAVGSIDGRVALHFMEPSNEKEMSCVFRCHPRAKDGKRHLVTVNEIVFHPSHFGAFVTGDNEGYAIIWDAQSKKRLFQFSRYSNSVASLSYNHDGQVLAVASSYTYQEANEMEEPPQIFINRMNENYERPSSSGSSK